MRIPNAALFIAIALVLLWVGITGRYDNLSKAWDVLRNKANDGMKGSNRPGEPTTSGGGGGGGGRSDVSGDIVSPTSLPHNLVDPATWHGNLMALTLMPTVKVAPIGGLM